MLLPNLGARLEFIDGKTTSVLGQIMLHVIHDRVTTETLFVVLDTVSPFMGVDVLLGTHYMKARNELTFSFSPGKGIHVRFNDAMPTHRIRCSEDVAYRDLCDTPNVRQWTKAVSAAGKLREPESVVDVDFVAVRDDSGKWVVEWKWESDPPESLYKGVAIYHRKLKSAQEKTLFDREVASWIAQQFIVPFTGKICCQLTWNPVVQTHKSTPVRPTLDYSILNPFIRCRSSYEQSEVCTDMLRKWRTCSDAVLVDIQKAYMQVHVAEHLHKFQVVSVNGSQFAMTRMGFGLNIAPRVLQAIIEHIVGRAGLTDSVLAYRDDLVVAGDKAAVLREVLLEHGFPTKPPKDLYNFSDGPTRALGLDIFLRKGEISWKRRDDSDISFATGKHTAKSVSSFIGRVCPGHLPTLGRIRPMALHLASANGKFVGGDKANWNKLAPQEIIDKCVDLAKFVKEADEANGLWKIPQTNRWALIADASEQAKACGITTAELWERNQHANCAFLEDMCWLVKDNRRHINLSELEAVMKGFRLAEAYAKEGDELTIVTDNSPVFGWLSQVARDEIIHVSGLYEILVERRLNILRELFRKYKITVQWVGSDCNPADKLTRVPDHWLPAPTTRKSVCASAILTESLDIREIQVADADCVNEIQNLESNGQLVVIDDVAYKKSFKLGTEQLQAILPESAVQEVSKRVHESLGHAGWKPTWYTMKSQYHVPTGNLAKQVQAMCANCEICAVKNAKTVSAGENYHSERVAPWQEIFIDILQVSSAAEGLPHLLIVVIDNYTKFVEAVASTNKTAETVCQFLETVICRYGTVRTIRCDNGLEFANAKFRALAQQHGITVKYGSVRNPTSQATVERVNQTLLKIIKALQFGQSCHWSEQLPEALSAYRRCPHENLANKSPQEALFGIPPGPLSPEFNRDGYSAAIFDLIDEQERAVQVDIEHPQKFSEGERVLVQIDLRRAVKTSYNFTPATVIRYQGRGSYLLRDDKGHEANINEKVMAKWKVPMIPTIADPIVAETGTAPDTFQTPPSSPTGQPRSESPMSAVPLENPRIVTQVPVNVPVSPVSDANPTSPRRSARIRNRGLNISKK